MSEILKTFLEYLESKIIKYNYEKYIVNDFHVVYDIEHSTIYSVLYKVEDIQSEHILVEEIFNDGKENINLKRICSNYTHAWISYYSFSGKLGEPTPNTDSQYKTIIEALPNLQIDNRYQEWPGYKIFFAGFILQDGSKKGYAIAKYSIISDIADLRKIGRHLINAYINSKEKEQANGDFRCGESYFSFILDKNMCDILEKRYISDVGMPILERGFEIADIKGFWATGYTKNKKEIPYSELERIKKDIILSKYIINDLYTENMKKNMPKTDSLKMSYFYVAVKFLYKDLDTYNDLSYLSDDSSISCGDKVLVNLNGNDAVGYVADAKWYKAYEVPYPVSRTKKIIKKIANNDELKKYGYSSEDFEFFYHKKYEPFYDYYIVLTLSDNKEIIEKISNELLQQKLVAGSQISTVSSDFWWEGKIQTKTEYRLEVRTRSDKLNEVKDLILSIHNYQVPEISAISIEFLTDAVQEWIDDSLGKSSENLDDFPTF